MSRSCRNGFRFSHYEYGRYREFVNAILANSTTGAAGINYITTDSSNMTISMKTAPPTGAGNVVFWVGGINLNHYFCRFI